MLVVPLWDIVAHLDSNSEQHACCANVCRAYHTTAGVQGSGFASGAVLYSHKLYALLVMPSYGPECIFTIIHWAENPKTGKNI